MSAKIVRTSFILSAHVNCPHKNGRQKPVRTCETWNFQIVRINMCGRGHYDHPKLPPRFTVEFGGRNDLGAGPVAYRPFGRVTLRRFVKGENRPSVLGRRADRPSTAATRLGGRWRLCDAAPSEDRGSLRREDGVRPDN